MNSNLMESINCFSKGLMIEPDNSDLKNLKQKLLVNIKELITKLTRLNKYYIIFKNFNKNLVKEMIYLKMKNMLKVLQNMRKQLFMMIRILNFY